MRFGRNLHRYRVATWAEAYVDYAGLKSILSTKLSLTSLKAAAGREIDIVQSFLAMRVRDIERQILVVNLRWGPCLGSSITLDYRDVSKFELEDLQASLVAIARDIDQLDWYLRINCEAVNRIRRKASAVLGLELPSDQGIFSEAGLRKIFSPCTTCLSLVDESLKSISDALGHNQGSRPLRSLLGEKFNGQIPGHVIDHLRAGDAESLAASLNLECQPAPWESPEQQSLLRFLLQVAIVHRSYLCQQVLLPLLRSSPGDSIAPDQDYLHKIIQQPGQSCSPDFRQTLDLLHASQRRLLQSEDSLGRLPLHYAAALGLDGTCHDIIVAVQDFKWIGSTEPLRMSLDAAGYTPLDYAVRHGCAAVIKTLLPHCDVAGNSKSELLASAISSGFIEASMYLIKEQWGLGFIGRTGKTVLHIAAEQGLTTVVKALVAQTMALVHINSQETSNGWTPLVMACIQGHGAVAETLLQAGADASTRDYRGWLAKDHAWYLGHPNIADAIRGPGSVALPAKPRKLVGAPSILPRPLPTDSVIFITLGTQDLYREVAEIDLTPYRRRIWPVQVPDSSLTLTISLDALGGEQDYKFALPVISDTCEWPCCFTTANPDNAAIVFKISRGPGQQPIGTAVALLASLNQGLGPRREGLMRDFTIPLVSDETGQVGSLVFTFLIIRPLNPELLPPTGPQHLKQEARTVLGGHRGNGRNDSSIRNLQIGENTLKSFQTAASHGASVIEFDVQLTKDDIPVIHHDFLMSGNALHTVTYNQFVGTGEALSGLNSSSESRPRRRSLCAPQDSAATAFARQMERTLSSYPGYRGNIILRAEKIHEPFVSLEQLLHGLPEDVAFDIEIKYPLLNEAIALQMDTLAPEINHFVDTILAVIYAHAGPHRRIFFTSFHPDICIALAVKQQTYPILFLGNSSLNPKGDKRTTNLQMACRFALKFGLAGVVMISQPFVESPGLIGLVKSRGLYTISWGPMNNHVGCVKVQAEAGLDMVIVDRVRLIRQGLDEMGNPGV